MLPHPTPVDPVLDSGDEDSDVDSSLDATVQGSGKGVHRERPAASADTVDGLHRLALFAERTSETATRALRSHPSGRSVEELSCIAHWILHVGLLLARVYA